MPERFRNAVVAAIGILLAGCVAPAFAQTFTGLMSGSWWDASRPGEGQLITFESVGGRNVVYLAYFTYTADGAATWQVGNIDYAPGATTLAIPLVTGSGPHFGAAYNAADFSRTSAGTATLEFVSCSQLRMRHSGFDGVTLNLRRLVGPLVGADCTAPAPPSAAAVSPTSALSGHWWNAGRAGEGQFITLESVGARNVATLAYFTYTEDGRARWQFGNADYSPGATGVTIPLVTGSGPRFGAAFQAADFRPGPAGSARIDFVSCSQVRFAYSGTVSFALDLARLVGPLTGYACSDAPRAATALSGPSPFPATCGAGTGTLYVNAEVEPSIAANPGNPDHLLAMWQQDRWSNGSSRGLVSAVSFDGGASWNTQPMAFSRCGGGTAANGGNFERATDPWVSFGPDGTAWAMSLSTTGALNAMLVSRSPDGGRTWGPSVTLVTDTTPYLNDKNSLTADPQDARYAYAVWDRTADSGGGPAMFARTVDGGATWEPARAIFDPGPSSQTISNVVVVPANGVLVNVALQIDEVPGTPRAAYVIAMRSEDRGQTWTTPVRVASDLAIGARDPQNLTPIRDGIIIPQAASGPGGMVHVVWQDSRFSAGLRDGIAYSRSADGGITWSTPVRVNPDPAVAAFTPAVHVLADGTIGVSYFDLRDDTTDAATLWTGYFLARSTDGGLTWQETRLADPFDLSTAPNANGLFLGDYMGLAGSGTAFDSLFVRTTGQAGNRNDVFHVRIAGAPGTAIATGKRAPVEGAWSAPWTAQAAAPFVVTPAWRARTGEAIELALKRRGTTAPP